MKLCHKLGIKLGHKLGHKLGLRLGIKLVVLLLVITAFVYLVHSWTTAEDAKLIDIAHIYYHHGDPTTLSDLSTALASISAAASVFQQLSFFKQFSWTASPTRDIWYAQAHLLQGSIDSLPSRLKSHSFSQAHSRARAAMNKLVQPLLQNLKPGSHDLNHHDNTPDMTNINNINKQHANRKSPILNSTHDNVNAPEFACFRANPIWRNHYAQIREAVRLVNETLWKAGVYYFLSHGSYLGSYRYHSMVPWDDDIDFQVHHRQKPLVVRLLQQLADVPDNQMRFADVEAQNGGHMKLGVACSATSHTSHSMKDCVMQFDIFFFDVYAAARRLEIAEKSEAMELHTFFPVRLRPFMGYLLPMPSNYTKFRSELIDYDHRNNLWSKQAWWRQLLYLLASPIRSEALAEARSIRKNTVQDTCAPAYRLLNCAKVIPCHQLHHIYPRLTRLTFHSLDAVFRLTDNDRRLLQTLHQTHHQAQHHHPRHSANQQILLEMTHFRDSLISYFIQVRFI